MEEHDDDIAELLNAEGLAMEQARLDIMRFPPLSKFPAAPARKTLADYEKLLISNGIGKKEAEAMVANDVEKAAKTLRGFLGNYHHIGPVRMGVLYHVALFAGTAELAAMKALFEALRARDYPRAQMELWMSNWPVMVSPNGENKRRVAEMAEELRTGEPYMRLGDTTPKKAH